MASLSQPRPQGWRRFVSAGILFVAAMTLGPAAVVTVTQRAPLESLSATGDVTGVTEAQVGAQYTLVSCANGQVILHDAQGNPFRLAVKATDYTPPAAPAAAVAQTPTSATMTNSVATPTPSTNTA